MTTSLPPILDLDPSGPSWPDEVADLTDRRRLLLRAVFGVDCTRGEAEAVFQLVEAPPPVVDDGAAAPARPGA